MTIQDLGSLGELVAAIATVATLIYLSIQIRQNTKSDEFAVMDKITADISEFSQNLLQDEHLQNVFINYIYDGVDFDTLGDKEKLEVRMVMQTAFIMAWRAFEARSNGRLSENSWHIMISLLRNSYFPSKTVVTWFKNYSHLYPNDFVEFIELEFEYASSKGDA